MLRIFQKALKRILGSEGYTKGTGRDLIQMHRKVSSEN
jgi:hypothetical protein